MVEAPARTQASIAHEALRAMIVRGELRPGEMLQEAELMDKLGLGRTPVRDAVQRLAFEGFIDVVPRRGTFVSQVNLEDAQQIFDIRIAIESVVAEAVIPRVTDAHLAELAAVIARVGSVDDEASDPSADRDLHELLLRIAGNRYLTNAYRQLLDAALRLFYLTQCPMETRADQLRTLKQVRRALKARDGEALERILKDHVRDFRGRVGAALLH